MTPQEAFEQIEVYANCAAAMFPASGSIAAIGAICRQMLADEMSPAVIASESTCPPQPEGRRRKQSSPPAAEALDCRVAGAPVSKRSAFVAGNDGVFWAAWHPQHGFQIPYHYEGAVAYADLDPVARAVRNFNADDKTTNRTGWRATKVTLVKVAS